MLRLLRRSAMTALKLPLAMAWDVISLGNMGDGSSTVTVLREHDRRKEMDEAVEVIEMLRKLW